VHGGLLGLRRRRLLLIGIGPEEVTHQALSWRLLEALQTIDRLDIRQIGRDAAVHHQELAVDGGGEGQHVKRAHDRVVHSNVILVLTLLPEVEKGRHLPALVVAAEHAKGRRKLDLEREEGDHDLHGEGATVHIVAQEDVLRGFGGSTDLQELD